MSGKARLLQPRWGTELNKISLILSAPSQLGRRLGPRREHLGSPKSPEGQDQALDDTEPEKPYCALQKVLLCTLSSHRGSRSGLAAHCAESLTSQSPEMGGWRVLEISGRRWSSCGAHGATHLSEGTPADTWQVRVRKGRCGGDFSCPIKERALSEWTVLTYSSLPLSLHSANPPHSSYSLSSDRC